MEPALVPDRPSMSTRPSSRNLSRMPQPKTPWALPPCRAVLILSIGLGEVGTISLSR
jgi:hypothetical protein